MSSERFWIVVLALTSFLVGLAAGFLVSLRRHPLVEPSPFAAYEARLVERFELDEERTRWLRRILASYDEDLEALKARHVRDMEDEFVEVGLACRDRIRRWVIPEERRQEFDRLAAGREIGAVGTETVSEGH